MRKLLFTSICALAGVAFANPLEFPSYNQKISVTYKTAQEAKSATVAAAGLPDNAKLAFMTRWDDTTGAHLAKGEMLHGVDYYATFFLNYNSWCAGFYTNEAPKLLKLGHGFGNHTKSHPFMEEVTENQYFRQILEQKIIIETKTGYTVNSFAAPFGWRSSIDQDRNELFTKILVETGHFVSQDFVGIPVKLPADYWMPTWRMSVDDRNPNKQVFDQQLQLNLKRMKDEGYKNPSLTYGIHSWCGADGNKIQAQLLKGIRNNDDWYYCSANMYGAYRYQFYHGGVKKCGTKGNSAIFEVTRFKPAQLGENVPLSLLVSGDPLAVELGDVKLEKTARNTWTLPSERTLAMPSVIDAVNDGESSAKIPGLAMSLKPDYEKGEAVITLKNGSGEDIKDVYAVLYLPPAWKARRIAFNVGCLKKNDALTRKIALGEKSGRRDYLEGETLYGASVDFVKGDTTARLYVTNLVPSHIEAIADSPRDVALVCGPFESGKFDEAKIIAMSNAGAPLENIGGGVNEKWLRMTDKNKTTSLVHVFATKGHGFNAGYVNAVTNIADFVKAPRLVAFEFDADEAGEAKVFCSLAFSARGPGRPVFYLNGRKFESGKHSVSDVKVVKGRNRIIVNAPLYSFRGNTASLMIMVAKEKYGKPYKCFKCDVSVD